MPAKNVGSYLRFPGTIFEQERRDNPPFSRFTLGDVGASASGSHK